MSETPVNLPVKDTSTEGPGERAGLPPVAEQVITQRLTFADGSEIIVIVKALPGEQGPGLLEKDLASRHYYAYLLERLTLIETMAKGENDRPDND